MAKKYIDAELLRKEIDEQMKSVPREVGRGAGTITSSGYGMMQAFQIIRSIIDSLQQEQPCDTCTNDKGCVTCKDALLEWINNAKNSLIIDNTKALQLGKIGSFAILDALIEKLNSM